MTDSIEPSGQTVLETDDERIEIKFAPNRSKWLLIGGSDDEYGTTLRLVGPGGTRYDVFVAIDTDETGKILAEVASVTEVPS